MKLPVQNQATTAEWIDLAAELLRSGWNERRNQPLTDMSVNVMNGMVEALLNGYTLSPKQRETFLRNFNMNMVLGQQYDINLPTPGLDLPEGQTAYNHAARHALPQVKPAPMITNSATRQAVMSVAGNDNLSLDEAYGTKTKERLWSDMVRAYNYDFREIMIECAKRCSKG